MIRFSAVLVVVAVGVLIGGIATSSLTLVYVAIVLSAVALILLGIGVGLKRAEIFGDASQQVGAYTGAAASQSALGAQHPLGNPVASNAQAGYGTGWTPPRGAGPAGGVAETRTDLAALSTDPAKSGSRISGGDPDETRLDLPATPPAPAPQAPAPATRAPASPPPPAPPAPGTSVSAPPPPDATSVDLPRVEAEPLPPLKPKAEPAADAKAETKPPSSPSAKQAAPTAAQPAVGSSQVAPTTIQPAIKIDETSLDLMNTGRAATGTSAPASGATGGSGVGSPSETSGSAGAPGSKSASGDRQVSVVPGVPRYHASNCILIRFMDAGDLEKMTAAEADAAGYTPCGACQADTGSFKAAD